MSAMLSLLDQLNAAYEIEYRNKDSMSHIFLKVSFSFIVRRRNVFILTIALHGIQQNDSVSESFRCNS